MKNIVSIEIINKLELLESTVDYILSFLSNTNLDYKKKYKLRLATEELISSRIINAYEDEGKIYIDLSIETDKIEISVRDLGEPYIADYNKFKKEDIHESTRGIQSYIIMNSVDCYGTQKLGKNGQRSFLQMYLPSPINFNKIDKDKSILLDKNFKGRTILDKDEEIIEAIKCIYSAYGYSYAYENLYYTDKFKEYIKVQTLTSIIAVNDSEEVAGHVALSVCSQYKKYPEVATMMVKSKYRGLNISEILLTSAIREGKKKGFFGLRARPTAFHPITQKLCIKHGFIPTGFLFHYVNSEGRGNCKAGNINEQGDRLDVAVCALPFNNAENHIIYPPSKHKDFIVSVYDSLGVNYEVKESLELHDTEEKINFSINKLMAVSLIIVNECSKDIYSSIKSYINVSRQNSVEMVELFINLNNVACSEAFLAAEKNGFIFSGIEPSSNGQDCIIMQHMLGNTLNFDNTIAVGNFKKILDYVRGQN